METMGFVFGMFGMSFGIIALGKIASLKKEFEMLITGNGIILILNI